MKVRWPFFVVALLLVVVGGVFALQGAGYLPSRVMHGKFEWLVIGSVMVVAGLAVGSRALRRPEG